MFYRISVGWALGKASWRAIWDNKSLMILPLISLLAQIAVIASYVGTGDVLGIVPALDELSNPSASQEEKILGYVMLFLIYMVSVFVGVVFPRFRVEQSIRWFLVWAVPLGVLSIVLI